MAEPDCMPSAGKDAAPSMHLPTNATAGTVGSDGQSRPELSAAVVWGQRLRRSLLNNGATNELPGRFLRVLRVPRVLRATVLCWGQQRSCPTSACLLVLCCGDALGSVLVAVHAAWWT